MYQAVNNTVGDALKQTDKLFLLENVQTQDQFYLLHCTYYQCDTSPEGNGIPNDASDWLERQGLHADACQMQGTLYCKRGGGTVATLFVDHESISQKISHQDKINLGSYFDIENNKLIWSFFDREFIDMENYDVINSICKVKELGFQNSWRVVLNDGDMAFYDDEKLIHARQAALNVPERLLLRLMSSKPGNEG